LGEPPLPTPAVAAAARAHRLRADRGRLLMSILAKRRRASAIAAADDPELFSAVAALEVEAVEEAYERHATALCGLALLTAEDSQLAEDAVAETFIALW